MSTTHTPFAVVINLYQDGRVVGMRRWTEGGSDDFTLRFDHLNEFWDFLRIISRVESEYQSRQVDYTIQARHVVDTVPSHQPSPALHVLCPFNAHRPTGKLYLQFLHPPSSAHSRALQMKLWRVDHSFGSHNAACVPPDQ